MAEGDNTYNKWRKVWARDQYNVWQVIAEGWDNNANISDATAPAFMAQTGRTTFEWEWDNIYRKWTNRQFG